MRLYRILGAGWAGTQADAKAKAKDAGAPWHEYDVPTDKPGLLAFLEERNVPAQADEPSKAASLRVRLDPDPMDAPIAPTTSPAPAAAPMVDRQDAYTADQVCDFILERASVAQVENIMACIGTRFAELAKKERQ